MTESRPMIPIAQPTLDGSEAAYVAECMASTWISSSGPFIDRFEQLFAEFCETSHGVSTSNGTTSLHLALHALGIGPGDEVIIPSLTYVASANAVRYTGATPVLVDSEFETMNLDPQAVAAAVTSRTAAIMPVHLYGHPADMDPILATAASHGLAVVEDAAEAHGARYRGRRVGSLGTCGSFSFFGNKIITTGEGGMVTTSDAALASDLRQYRGQGQDPARRYWFPVVGFNYRMTNVAASIGTAQVESIESQLSRRERIREWYDERLTSLDEVIRPSVAPWADAVNWLYTVRLATTESGRDHMMSLLAGDGIETRPVFYPMHVMPPYLGRPGQFPMAERIGRTGVSLPTFSTLTEDQVDYIVGRIAHHLPDLPAGG